MRSRWQICNSCPGHWPTLIRKSRSSRLITRSQVRQCTSRDSSTSFLRSSRISSKQWTKPSSPAAARSQRTAGIAPPAPSILLRPRNHRHSEPKVADSACARDKPAGRTSAARPAQRHCQFAETKPNWNGKRGLIVSFSLMDANRRRFATHCWRVWGNANATARGLFTACRTFWQFFFKQFDDVSEPLPETERLEPPVDAVPLGGQHGVAYPCARPRMERPR